MWKGGGKKGTDTGRQSRRMQYPHRSHTPAADSNQPEGGEREDLEDHQHLRRTESGYSIKEEGGRKRESKNAKGGIARKGTQWKEGSSGPPTKPCRPKSASRKKNRRGGWGFKAAKSKRRSYPSEKGRNDTVNRSEAVAANRNLENRLSKKRKTREYAKKIAGNLQQQAS